VNKKTKSNEIDTTDIPEADEAFFKSARLKRIKGRDAIPSEVVNHIKTSDIIWFRPQEAFFKFFEHYNWRWRRYHDCGAGAGLLTKLMRERKFECAGWDLYPRDKSLAPVGRLDTGDIAERMDTSDVAILARPCHHPDLIEATLRSALEMGEAFYVGKADNIITDLSEFEWEIAAEEVGEEHEALVRIRHPKGKFHIRRLINNDGRREWWWYNAKRSRYVGEPNGIAGFDDDGVEVFEEQTWASDLQILETKEDACKPDSDMGWIAPDGEWFGCNYAEHDRIARAVLGCSIGRLEELSFCRCYGDQGRGRMMWTCGWSSSIRDRKPTKAQVKVLRAKGYDTKV
jgi:hypothetical protein